MIPVFIDTNIYEEIGYNFDNKNPILQAFKKLVDENEIKKDKRIEEEYNSILDDMNSQSNNYISNIFQTETDKGRNIAKFVSGSWLFFILGLIMPFTVDKNKGKRLSFNNIMGGILCLIIGGILGYVCLKIPNIINFAVNIILYQIILIFLAYTIASTSKKAQ